MRLQGKLANERKALPPRYESLPPPFDLAITQFLECQAFLNIKIHRKHRLVVGKIPLRKLARPEWQGYRSGYYRF